MIMALPLGVGVLLLFVFLLNASYALVVKGQKKGALVGMSSPLIGMAQVLMYFLYLYITRTVFDVMTCRSKDPPEFDAGGSEKLYMAGTSEQCGVAGGVQMALLAPAVIALLVYVLGYPAFVTWNLCTHRELIMEDQLLRAMRTGDDKLTNPHALEFRKRWARTYYQFRPDVHMWVLAIILRKFLIAISSLVFNTNQNFQMAAMLLVLFCAYAAQVRFLPYMGPGTFEAVLSSHEAEALAGSPLQKRLAATISRVQAQGRKRSSGTTFGAAKKLSALALAGAFARFLFDYNTVEALLLASALLVSLSGIMFGASTSAITSDFYKASQAGVLYSVLILIAVTIVYWLAVVIVEVMGVVSEQAAAARTAKGSAAAARKKGGKSASGSSFSSSDSAIVGPVDATNNPMFVSANGSAVAGASGISPEAVAALRGPPEASAWHVIREAYVAQEERAATLAATVAKLKADIARASMDAEAEEDPSSTAASPRARARAKRDFAPVQSDGAGSKQVAAMKAIGRSALKGMKR
jgi:hypothetical protein